MAHSLLLTLPHVFHCSVDDGLLAAAAMAVARFHEDRGVEHRKILVGCEIDGRDEAIVPGSDVSRTVGQFGIAFPLRLDMLDADIDAAYQSGPAAGRVVKLVKEALRAVPDSGIGYRLLCYLNPDTATNSVSTQRRRSASAASSSLTKASLGSDQRVSGGRQRPRRTLCAGPTYSALPPGD